MNVAVKTIAQGKWKYILIDLGMDQKFLSRRHGPCPICGGTDRFRFMDTNGDGVFICNQCGSGDGFTLAEKALGRSFKDIADVIRRKAKDMSMTKYEESAPVDTKTMARMWKKSEEIIPHDPVFNYLHRRLKTVVDVQNLRCLDGNMIAKVQMADGVGCNIHTTYLTPDGKKADVEVPKRVLKGSLPDGCAIRLFPPAKVLGVAEGIETALSAALLFKVPVWATVNGNLLSKWVPPEETETVVVFGDNDVNYTGQSKAYALANRLTVQFKRKVEVKIPPVAGWDWNDALQGHQPQIYQYSI